LDQANNASDLNLSLSGIKYTLDLKIPLSSIQELKSGSIKQKFFTIQREKFLLNCRCNGNQSSSYNISRLELTLFKIGDRETTHLNADHQRTDRLMQSRFSVSEKPLPSPLFNLKQQTHRNMPDRSKGKACRGPVAYYLSFNPHLTSSAN